MTIDTFAPLPPAAPASAEPIQEHEADTTPPMQPARDPLPELIQHRRLGVPTKVWRYLIPNPDVHDSQRGFPDAMVM